MRVSRTDTQQDVLIKGQTTRQDDGQTTTKRHTFLLIKSQENETNKAYFNEGVAHTIFHLPALPPVKLPICSR